MTREPANLSQAEQRTTRADSPEARELLMRGDLMLASLSRRAVAARAEAECAELRLVLSQARHGTLEPLQAWLLSNELRQPTTIDDPHGEVDQATPTIDSWDQLLPFARKRLQHRAKSNAKSNFENKAGSNFESSGEGNAEKTPSRGSQSARGPLQGGVKGRPAIDESSTEQRPQRVQTLDFELLTRVDGPAAPSDEPGVARFRGMLVSLLAHLVLVVLLALMTLKLPSPPASLAFQSSSVETSVEVVELVEPVESREPAESTELPSMPEISEVADSFAAVRSDLGDSLAEVNLPSATGASAAAGLAAAASVASAAPTSVNSSFFGAAASGNCFCYVIDGSGSMRGGAWEAAKLELWKSLAGLEAKQRFYIIFFNRELAAIPQLGSIEPADRALYATQENLDHARRWIDSIQLGIGGPPNDALELAIAKEPDAIYLLTDGVTTVDVAKFLRSKNRVEDIFNGSLVRSPIHCIAFYSLEGQSLLRQIADENRGQFIHVPDPSKR
jgi:hypothetical protein